MAHTETRDLMTSAPVPSGSWGLVVVSKIMFLFCSVSSSAALCTGGIYKELICTGNEQVAVF